MFFSTCSQGHIPYCYTGRLLPSGAAQGELPEEQERVPWGMTVPRNSLARYTAWHLRIKRLVQFIFADPVCNNALTNRAALLCRALRRVNRLCSSTVSGTANMSRHGSTPCSPTVEKLLCRSLFSERSHVGNLRQTLQGKRGDSQEGGKPQVVYPLVRPRGVSALPAAGRGKSPAQPVLKKAALNTRGKPP